MNKLALTLTLIAVWAINGVHAAEFFCPSGDVSCLTAAINDANQNGEENTINLAPGTYTLSATTIVRLRLTAYHALRVL